MRSPIVSILIVLFCIGLTSEVFAGLYHPDWLPFEEIDNQGHAQPLGPDNFWLYYMKAREVGTKPLLPQLGSARQEVELEAARLKGLPQRSVEDNAKLTADLILLNELDEAKSLLQKGSRTDGFLNAAHQARAYQSGMLDRAKYFEELAINEDFPEKLYHLNKSRLNWYHRIERDYYFPWIVHRDEEEQSKQRGGGVSHNDEAVDPLFPKPSRPRIAPIRFMGEDGAYHPGELAAGEKSKLPPDAIAIVQQMMLWNPWDLRLAWLLAELYAAQGNFAMAEKLLDSCRQAGYSPLELSQHREAIQASAQQQREQLLAARKLEEEKSRVEQQQKLVKDHEARMNKIYVWTATGLILAVIAYWQTREIMRRIFARRNSAPLD